MEGAKTVDSLLREKGVTPEEEEQLREIIEECRTREAQIKEASESARQNMEKLADTLKMVFDTFAVISNSVDEPPRRGAAAPAQNHTGGAFLQGMTGGTLEPAQDRNSLAHRSVSWADAAPDASAVRKRPSRDLRNRLSSLKGNVPHPTGRCSSLPPWLSCIWSLP